jgi:hypothetical protein
MGVLDEQRLWSCSGVWDSRGVGITVIDLRTLVLRTLLENTFTLSTSHICCHVLRSTCCGFGVWLCWIYATGFATRAEHAQ